ncbi:hypothetical protein PU783_000625 [Cronobacter sakazakii]|nr:hypothetical protein [Cronobacter sakazakii]EKM6438492.1 hypothetical protein [Cronobacter sakazakii]KAB1063615.1 hypothetical protein AUN10_06070 [Cronobacter sakazakii]
MNNIFFETDDFHNAASYCKERIAETQANSPFEEERNKLIIELLDYIKSTAKKWDEFCAYNIEHLRSPLLDALHPDRNQNINEGLVFSLLFGFNAEFNISNANFRRMSIGFSQFNEMFSVNEKFFRFGVYNIDNFPEPYKKEIHYALCQQPTLTVKKCLQELNTTSYNDFLKEQRAFAHEMKGLREEMNEKTKIVNHLNSKLEEQKNAFNFIGLQDAFSTLSAAKSTELAKTKWLLFLMGVLLCLPLIWEARLLSSLVGTGDILGHLLKSIPLLSLTLILIYFFRVVLNNFNSVRAQLMQINLRKNLCQFVHNYAEYSKDIISDKINPLTKFEDIIFSNIMGSDEKTPSTFDGIEQLASIIKAVKGN